ncbi:hypothetical protein ACHAXT_009707 [Thalassiosira profunda]
MASSARWKRFGFFERRTLALPPPVVRDLVPSKSSAANSARGGGGGGGTVSGEGALSPENLYRDDGEPTDDDRRRIGRGDYFSFVAASGVGLPSSLSGGDDGELGEEVGAVATRRGAGGDGAPAMKAGLAALHGSTTAPEGGGQPSTKGFKTAAAANGGGGELVLLFASSRRTSKVHCVDVTVRCTPANPHALEDPPPPAGGAAEERAGTASSARGGSAFASSSVGNESAALSNSNASLANPEELDGWRGHYDPFASAGGFIVGKKDGNSNTMGAAPSSRAPRPPAGAKGRKKEQRILDEHLDADFDSGGGGGGGGALFGASPFAGDGPPDSAPKARIVGLAACTHPSAAKGGANGGASNTLYVAAVTDAPGSTGVVVHANPHLALSSLPPSSASNATAATKLGAHSWCCTPSGAFDCAAHGNPRCVSVLPGVVAVGTDAGWVLLYVFKCDGRTGRSRGGKLALVAEVPAPRSGGGTDSEERKDAHCVSQVELIGPAEEEDGSGSGGIHRLFVAYRRRRVPSAAEGESADPAGEAAANNAPNTAPAASGPSGGVCCYDLGGLRIPGRHNKPPLPSKGGAAAGSSAPVVSARYDLDGRDVGSGGLCDGVGVPPAPPAGVRARKAARADDAGDNSNDNEAAPPSAPALDKTLPRFAVARPDGLHLYAPSEKAGVCPVDGPKLAMCALPSPPVVHLKRPVRPPVGGEGGGGSPYDGGAVAGAGARYALVAATDAKSNRDAVDVYDTANKLVGCHVLLSPGHRALRAVGLYSPPAVRDRTLVRGGRTSAAVWTSGGSIVTLTEKATPAKVELLTQKHLYGAAISVAYADPQSFGPEDITALYRRHAEHLYRRGEFAAAMDQYILTIGSLEPSHVIFRFLDAPKIPLAVRYLEALRRAGLAAGVHDALLRTCYLKLGDVDAASKIILTTAAASATDAPRRPDGADAPSVPVSPNLLASADDPSELLAAICSLDAPQAVAALVAHGVTIARSLPRETAGVVLALCDGSYAPTAAADAAAGRSPRADGAGGGGSGAGCEKYPIGLFANAFMENPKLFRLILSHCRRNDCVLTPTLRRTLLELTLDEWNAAKRTGDLQVEKLRHDEALSMLSENHVDDMGDHESLVVVQAARFAPGEILLSERLRLLPALLDEHARRGDARSRRRMLALCEARPDDPDVFAEVLARFVGMAGERLDGDALQDEASVRSDSDVGGLLHDIHEALLLAREDRVDVPPVRILRILAGEGAGRFSSDRRGPSEATPKGGVPLAAAMDYVGAVLDDAGRKIRRLQNNVDEYGRLCRDMESEIDALRSPGTSAAEADGDGGRRRSALPNVDIDDMYSKLCRREEEEGGPPSAPFPARGGDDASRSEARKEDFWREMERSDDPFETICFYMSKGYLEDDA